MQIFIVDDNDAFRDTLKDFLQNKLGHSVVGQASSGEEFLVTAPSYDPDIILMDIEMYGISGIEATHRMNILFPKAKIIAVTMHIEKVFLQQLIENGFKACVYKTDIFEKLEMAINRVNAGKFFFPNDIKLNDE